MDYIVVFLVGVFFGWLSGAISYRFIVESGFLSKFHCPLCNHNLKWFELIPIISYLFVNMAKCRYCKGHISQIYPVLELLGGVLFVLLFIRFRLSFQLLILCFCVYLVFIAAIVDIETLFVPDIILYTLLIVSVFYAVFYSENSILTLSLSLSLFFLLIGIGKFSQRALQIQSIGFGDVILIPVLTNFLHYDLVPYFIIGSGVIGLIFGLVWKFFLEMGSKFPFIPPIFLAFFASILF